MRCGWGYRPYLSIGPETRGTPGPRRYNSNWDELHPKRYFSHRTLRCGEGSGDVFLALFSGLVFLETVIKNRYEPQLYI